MCGIVGLIHDGRKELLNRMNEVQIHRGPDFGGFFWDEQALVGLAMRRLSIVDLANGSQPMTNEDGSIVLVYNGEVITLIQDGLYKVMAGFTSLEEIMKLVEADDELNAKTCLRNKLRLINQTVPADENMQMNNQNQ